MRFAPNFLIGWGSTGSIPLVEIECEPEAKRLLPGGGLYHRRARLVCAEMRLSDRLPLLTCSASCETGGGPTIQIKLITPKRIRLKTIAAERTPRTTERLRRKDMLNRSGCDIWNSTTESSENIHSVSERDNFPAKDDESAATICATSCRVAPAKIPYFAGARPAILCNGQHPGNQAREMPPK
jgi:hypothetical protein